MLTTSGIVAGLRYASRNLSYAKPKPKRKRKKRKKRK